MTPVTVRLALLFALLLGALSINAEETRLTVRVLANDAKLIGDLTGGARVTIRDAANGELLARGVTRGGTGDTGKIIQEPQARQGTVYDTDGAAAMTATLDIQRPTPVEILVEGPLDYPEAMQSARHDFLLIPGQHVEGEGLVITLHGFIVEPLLADHEAISPSDGRIEVTTRLRLLCGCPTQPGGLWDSDDYDMVAQLLDGDTVVATSDLHYTGRTSHFSARFPAPEPGTYTLDIRVSDVSTGNSGWSRHVFTVDHGER